MTVTLDWKVSLQCAHFQNSAMLRQYANMVNNDHFLHPAMFAYVAQTLIDARVGCVVTCCLPAGHCLQQLPSSCTAWCLTAHAAQKLPLRTPHALQPLLWSSHLQTTAAGLTAAVHKPTCRQGCTLEKERKVCGGRRG